MTQCVPQRNQIITHYQYVKTSSFGRANDEYEEDECPGQLILFAVSFLQDGTSLTGNVLGVYGHHGAIC